jgi:hypothetical protein
VGVGIPPYALTSARPALWLRQEASVHALGSVKCAVLPMASLESVLSVGPTTSSALDTEMGHLTL